MGNTRDLTEIVVNVNQKSFFLQLLSVFKKTKFIYLDFLNVW